MANKNPFEEEILWCLDVFRDIFVALMLTGGAVWAVLFGLAMLMELAERLGL